MSAFSGTFREFRLDNGLHVVLQETSTRTVYAQCGVYHGSMNELPGEEGIAHFLEHVLLNCGNGRYTVEEVRKIRNTFGYSNASTGRGATKLDTEMIPEDLELCLDYMSGAMFEPVLDAHIVERERGPILRELASKLGNPANKWKQEIGRALFGEGWVTYDTLGKPDVVKSATSEDLRRFHSRGYFVNNMYLFIFGCVPENTEKIISRYFSDRQTGQAERFIVPKPKPLTTKTIFHRGLRRVYEALGADPEKDDINSEITMSFLAPDITQENGFATMVLSNILGGSRSSRLFKKVREKEGLAYSVSSSYYGLSNASTMDVDFEVSPTKQDKVIDMIFEEMIKLREEPVSKEELENAKKRIRFEIAKSGETNGKIIDRIRYQVDRGITIDDELAGIQAVTTDDVMRAAIENLPESREEGKYVIHIIDPLKD